jgi:hypothetical protein
MRSDVGTHSLTTPETDNIPRITQHQGQAHVESYFWRANHPELRRAFWLKATILSPTEGQAVAEVWCCTFDGESGHYQGARQTVPLCEARFDEDGSLIEVAGCRFDLAAVGHTLNGAVDQSSARSKWSLQCQPVETSLGQPLCLFPTRRMLQASFPRNKTVTPAPAAHFNGQIEVNGETWAIDDWLGMQGHNWGQAHAHEYAWGQCLFTAPDGSPCAMVEAYTAKLRIAGLTTPALSGMVVRHGQRSYRFDRIIDLWNQRSETKDLCWVLKMKGRDGKALLQMEATPEEVVCLGYTNPDAHLSYCLNSKLAKVRLQVVPSKGESFECFSEHGGALEFLRHEPDPSLGEVI